ncbi:MAG: LCP family protein [Oscillospiraceae bacterium]|nr:LCP family protein [Oscillospiraceae bacterium]
MKLIGNSKKSQHTRSGQSAAPRSSGNYDSYNNRSKSKSSSKKKKVITITVIAIITMVVLIGGLFAIIRWEIQPLYDLLFPLPGEHQLGGIRTPRPYNPDDPDNPNNPGTPDPRFHDDDGQPLPIDKVRSLNIYTFMIFGIDNDGNTDVIMVGAFDTENYTVNIVSIFRDTLMNSPWDSPYYAKKANFVQPRMRRDHPSDSAGYALAMEDTVDRFEDLLGFNVDFWFTVNMRAFVSLVDNIGGVWFDVPRAMPEWSDPNYPEMGSVSLPAGNQQLNGRQALAYLRFRKIEHADGTVTHLGDEFRTRNQQNFLKAAATQILSSNNVNVTSLAGIFLNNVRTDIALDNLIRLGREFIKVKPADIEFNSFPGEFIFRYEYFAVNVDEWLEIVNSKLNPFNFDIEANDVSILTIDANRNLYVTDNRWQGSRDWLPNGWQP